MSELAEDFRFLKQKRKEEKEHLSKTNIDKLKAYGVRFKTKNFGTHLIIKHNGKEVDFWPSTDKWKPRNGGGKKRIYYGIDSLLDHLS